MPKRSSPCSRNTPPSSDALSTQRVDNPAHAQAPSSRLNLNQAMNPHTIPTAAAALHAAGVLASGCTYAALSAESQLFGKTLLAGSNSKEIALTYDDGPN